ncbi:starvation-inducible outer membrane lipoprotein [Providencia alcalifaciens]|nr:starvation-inducible outer membrane lipoprotein [Providencia alcalifaciens]
MRLLIIVFTVMLSACASSGQDLSKEKSKDDPYADSTLSSIKASQKVQIDQKVFKRGY